MMKRLRIGLVGCGNWGKNILRDLISLGCEIHVVARSKESKQRAKQYGATKIVSSVGELSMPHGFIVATPSATHADVIDQLIGEYPGIPIYTEKPLVIDSASAKRLARKAADTLFVMDKWRYHAGIHALRDIARKKEFGRVLGLKCTRVQWGKPHDDADCIWHMTPHDLAITLEILELIPEPVFARGEIVGEEATGILGVLGSNPWVVITVSCRYPDRKREIRLFCEEAVAVLDDAYGDHISIALSSSLNKKDSPAIISRLISTKMPLKKELEAFVAFLRGGPPPKSSSAEGALIVKRISQLRKLANLD